MIQYLPPNSTSFGVFSHNTLFGENSFRTLYGFWGRSILGFRRRFRQGPAKISTRGRICLGLPKGFREGSAKVSPKLHHGRFHEARLSFAASLVLWGRSVLRFRGSFHQGSAKFPPSFHPGSTKLPYRGVFGSLEQIRLGLPKGSAERSTKVLQVSLMSLVLWGGCVLGCQKVCGRFHGGSTKDSRRPRKFRDLSGLPAQVPFDLGKVLQRAPPSLLCICLPVPSTLFGIFLDRVSFRAIVSKSFGAKWHVCLLGFFAANSFRLPKGFLECSSQTALHICLRLSRGFWGKWLLLQKRFCGGFAQVLSTLISQMAAASLKQGAPEDPKANR